MASALGVPLARAPLAAARPEALPAHDASAVREVGVRSFTGRTAAARSAPDAGPEILEIAPPSLPEGQTAYGESYGDVFRLRSFPTEPSDWIELGGVECHQTCGYIDVATLLPPYKNISPEHIRVQVSCRRLTVTIALEGHLPEQVEALTGALSKPVHRDLTTWTLVDTAKELQGVSSAGGLYLLIRLRKLKHMSWKGLWQRGQSNLMNMVHRKINCNVAADPKEQEKASKLDELITVEANTMPPPIVEMPPLFSQLLLGLHDAEEDEEDLMVQVHFNGKALENLEAIFPLEELFVAEVSELRLAIYLRLSDDIQLEVFEASLKGRCMPRETTWCIERAAKGELNGRGDAFNPALLLSLRKHPEECVLWDEPLSYIRHPEGLDVSKPTLLDSEGAARAKGRIHIGAMSSGVQAEYERSGRGAAEASSRPLRDFKEHLVDNGLLKAKTKGLGYRKSRNMHDKDGEELAPWGSTVFGQVEDGWLAVGKRFLPMTLNGITVLTTDLAGSVPRLAAQAHEESDALALAGLPGDEASDGDGDGDASGDPPVKISAGRFTARAQEGKKAEEPADQAEPAPEAPE